MFIRTNCILIIFIIGFVDVKAESDPLIWYKTFFALQNIDESFIGKKGHFIGIVVHGKQGKY